MISLSLNEDSLHQFKSRQIFSHAKCCRFMDALARESLERKQCRIRKRLAHVTKHFEHLIKFVLETVRLNDEITELQFLTKYPQEHQGKPTMLLQCLKWFFPLE